MLAETGIKPGSFSTRVDCLIHYSTRTLKQSRRKNRGFIKLKGVKMPCLMPIRVKSRIKMCLRNICMVPKAFDSLARHGLLRGPDLRD